MFQTFSNFDCFDTVHEIDEEEYEDTSDQLRVRQAFIARESAHPTAITEVTYELYREFDFDE